MFDLITGKEKHLAGGGGTPVLVSSALHVLMLGLIVVIPLLYVTDSLPDVPDTMMAFVALSADTLIRPSKMPEGPAGAAARAGGAPPVGVAAVAAPVPLMMSFSVLVSSVASACWRGRTWISPSPVCGTSSRFTISSTLRYARGVATMMSDLDGVSATTLLT